ncbi:spore coat U domain-containing protein [Spongiibacter sp.]|uniref:Csu type fimbrial protein n=1 Tax=Spongiibacter sp. TaxID=2024860 RepID=UPI00356AEE0D
MGSIRSAIAVPTRLGCLVAVLASASAFAATTTTTFSVTATVVDSCSVSAANLAFGNVAPVNNLNIDATGSVTVTCSLGTSYAVALDDGTNSSDGSVNTRRMTDGLSNYLSYQMYTDVGRTDVWGETSGTDDVTGTGTGLSVPIVVYGRIASGQQETQTGSYTDTVNVTVTY